jgi:hypothetical protein
VATPIQPRTLRHPPVHWSIPRDRSPEQPPTTQTIHPGDSLRVVNFHFSNHHNRNNETTFGIWCCRAKIKYPINRFRSSYTLLGFAKHSIILFFWKQNPTMHTSWKTLMHNEIGRIWMSLALIKATRTITAITSTTLISSTIYSNKHNKINKHSICTIIDMYACMPCNNLTSQERWCISVALSALWYVSC